MAARIVLEETYFTVFHERGKGDSYERIFITIAETKLRALEKIAAKTHPDFHCDCEGGCVYLFPYIIIEFTIDGDHATHPLYGYNDIYEVKASIDEHSPMIKSPVKKQ